jgi:protein involved in polysaccharide export with SLBB domain
MKLSSGNYRLGRFCDPVRGSCHIRAAVVGVLLLLVGLSASVAQLMGTATPATTAPSATGSLTGVEAPIISESYILNPGDQLLITINGSAAYSYWAWVSYEGKIQIEIPNDFTKPTTYQTVDVVGISGLNMKAAQETLGLTFQRYFRQASVKLTLTSLRSGVVYVTGEVLEPGAVLASPVDRVSTVLLKAGGLTPIGSRTVIQLFRNGKFHATVNLERFEGLGDLAANPFVESGDRVYVPPVTGIVTVKGAIFGRGDYRLRTSALTTEKERVSEGIYELSPGEKVIDLINKAGGTTPWADLKATYVTRRDPSVGTSTNIPVDLTRVYYLADSSVNIELRSSDVVVVPPINTLVYVEGEVTNPLSYLHTPNLRFTDYIGMAGGPTPNGNIPHSYIIRGGSRVSTLNNPIVEPGDIVYVPRITLKWWQDYLTIFSAIGMPLATTVISILLSQRILGK